MGEFITAEDPAADEAVRRQLGLITGELVRAVRPEAVVLAGSFGRGEGAVVRRNGGLEFLSDYEICVVANRLRQRLQLEQIARNLSARLSAKASLFWVTPARLRTNRVKNLSWGPAPPSVLMYELKAGSRLLYGAAPLEANPIAPEKLPFQEGLYFILNRMMECAAAVVEQESAARCNYALAKLVLALGDALLIRGRAYHYSCRRRLETLGRRYAELCQPVFAGNGFLELYAAAARTKLSPGQAEPLEPAAVVEAAARTLRYLAFEEMGFPGFAWPDWPRHYLEYCRRANVPPLYRAGPLPLPANWYDNLVSALKLARAGIRFRPAALARRVCWRQIVYAVAPPVFFAGPPAPRAGAGWPGAVQSCLAHIMRRADLPEGDDWRAWAGLVVRLWRCLC